MNLLRKLTSQPRHVLLIEAWVGTGVVMAVDLATPLELSMYVFYALPIFIVSLAVGPRHGFALALTAAVGSWLANVNQAPALGLYAWRGVNRLTSFLFVATCGMAIRRERQGLQERVEALERARELEQEILRISEREQMRIGQDLHDGLCQTLAAINFAAAEVKSELEASALPQAESVAELQSLLQSACVEARSLARGIFPIQMDEGGLVPALHELGELIERTFHVPINFHVEGEIHIPDLSVAMHLYRIAQEALSNAARHSGALHIDLSLRQNRDSITLAVADDGRGLRESAGQTGGMGLRTIRYRASLIGGNVEISCGSTAGVEVRCTVALERALVNEPPDAAPLISALA